MCSRPLLNKNVLHYKVSWLSFFEGSSVEKDKEWIHPHINKIASSDNGGNTQWLKQCVAGDRMCFLWLLLISSVRWNGDINGLLEQLWSKVV